MRLWLDAQLFVVEVYAVRDLELRNAENKEISLAAK